MPTNLRPPTGSPTRTPAAVPRLETAALLWWSAAAVIATADLCGGQALAAAVAQPQSLNHGMLQAVPGQHVSVLLAVYAASGAAASGWMWRSARRHARPGRAARVAVVATVVVLLLGGLVLVDATLLAALGYLPAVVLVAPFSAELRSSLDVYLDPAVALQAVAVAALVLLSVSAVRFARHARAACVRCGRLHDGGDPAWQEPSAAARWGRAAALVAAAVPATYALTRFAWALGISLGFDQEISGIDLLGPIGLGGFALLGAVLTLGLYQGWGEVFPRWIPGLAGRRVPVLLAVVPATAVAALILPAGVAVVAMGLRSGLLELDPSMVAAVGPAVLWPVWSITLGVAAYGYWLRRRGACRRCGRG